MAFWCRIKQSKLKLLSHQFSRSYLQVPYKPSLTYANSYVRTLLFGHNPASITVIRPTEFCINARFFAAPVQAVKQKEEEKDKSGPRLNEKITAQFVRLVVPEGEHLIVSRNEALDRARKLKLDLVEVQRTADPPVCKLMDYHKQKYIKQAKGKEKTKSKEVTLKTGDCKEIKFTAKCEQKDLQTKADTILRMMERGYRVKCVAVGTEEQDLEGLLFRLAKLIEDVSMVESGPRVEKKQAFVIVRHIKFGPSKKGHGKKLSKLGVSIAATESPTTEAIPNDAPVQFGDDEIINDDADTEPDKYLEKSRSTRSVSDNSSIPVAASPPAKTRFPEVLPPKPILDYARANTGPSSPPKLPVETESRYTRSEPRNRIQPTVSKENDRQGATDSMRFEPQIPGRGKVPQSDLNQSPAGPSFGAFSVPKDSAGRYGVATQHQRNKEGNSLDKAPKQDQPRPGPPNNAAPSYGIFSTPKTNAPSKQGATEEINTNRKGIPLDSEKNPSQKQGVQGGFGIFSKKL